VLSFPTRSADEPEEDREVTKRVELPAGAGEQFIETLRLDARGERTDGFAPDAVGEAAAYSLQMAELVGELLAVGPPTSLELTLTGASWLVVRANDGGVIVARGGRLVDAAMLRRSLAP
jgi:hypothetical protein